MASTKTDLYAVLGVDRDCSGLELRNAYKKLAMKWHPDRFLASGNSKSVEEAKKKFQGIQEAYSVLSDENKRMLYDLGVDNDEDDDENDMGDFLREMMDMMNQTKGEGGQSFEELQNLFCEMFQQNEEFYSSVSQSSSSNNTTTNLFSCPSSGENFSQNSNSDTFNSNKRNCSSMTAENTKMEFNMGAADFGNFSMGMGSGNMKARGRNGRRTGREPQGSSRRDMSAHDSKVMA